MREAANLLSLCIESVSTEIIHGDRQSLLDAIAYLPPDLFDCLLKHLPPLALHHLHQQTSIKQYNNILSSNHTNKRKRGRYDDFNVAWETLFKSRWPEAVGAIQPYDKWTKQGLKRCEVVQNHDWHQMYWEAHVQSCLDKAAETALLPSFDGRIGEITIPGTIMITIGCKMRISGAHVYSKLSYHCQQFGCYVRCLKLQNALCVAETCYLLRDSKLQSLVMRRIKSKEQINGVAKLLQQNSETLSSVEFAYCKLSSAAWDTIYKSLYPEGTHQHQIQHLSINTSTILESDLVSLPSGFLSFLTLGRSLLSLDLSDNRLGPRSAKVIFNTLLDAPSGLSILDLSDNNIAGWLSNINGKFSSCFPGSSQVENSLWSLHVLSLRGNNLRKNDTVILKNALAQMRNLKYLDISDNPIGDEGIRNLIPYFVQASARDSCLLELKLENCNLSSSGVTDLLESLLSLKSSLNSLSLGDNELGSKVAGELAKFLGESCIRVLNIEDIGLGSSGFQEFCEKLPENIKLVEMNISKNRGGIEAAKFLAELILRAPELAALDAGYNFMPSESLAAIYSALKQSKGTLKKVDLTGNTACYQPPKASFFAEFQFCGKPIVVLPSLPTAAAPYDDDP